MPRNPSSASTQSIPKELQSLVYWSIKALGLAIKAEYGPQTYRRIESVRKNMKSIRSTAVEETLAVLHKQAKGLKRFEDGELFRIAHSFALMLELINSCESAYRTWRIRQKAPVEFRQKPRAANFVFTAHPTEARSPESLFLFQKITLLLEQALQYGTTGVDESLSYLLRLALKVPMSREHKPTVKDEAEYLYSIVLREEIIDQQISFSRQGIPVNFRSWVGGDKDGHPNVDEKTLLTSLELSRKHILGWIERKIDLVMQDLSQLGIRTSTAASVLKKAESLRKLTKGDGKRVEAFKSALRSALDSLEMEAGMSVPVLEEIRELLTVYPALVLPLEVREDSELVRAAVASGKPSRKALKDFAITRMIQTLNDISEGSTPKWYVRCLVLSMVMDEHDIQAGYQLICLYMGDYRIPVVPLFENAHALENGTAILEHYFQLNKGRKEISTIEKAHHEHWESRFEVMLGYSDSSKESGVLPSRYLIQRALQDLEEFFRRHTLTPIYFHGSGGSIERGGGSIKEQTQGWPVSAVNIFKATVQGEMVARNFGSALIMRSQIEKIVDQLSTVVGASTVAGVTTKTHADTNPDSLLHAFSEKIQSSYQEMVQTDAFFEHILQATPYSYLDVLRIGSRPSKRQTASRKLRAIPWVLCWTQTRVLFPTWWGVGSAYAEMPAKQKTTLRKELKSSPFLSSFVKILGFTLRKVELPIWRLYLERLDLPKAQIEEYYAQFESEYQRTLTFFHEMTGQQDLLWHRPWLGESIYFRSSMIHPLNLIQLEALSRSNESLLRETVTGVACGMMTTG